MIYRRAGILAVAALCVPALLAAGGCDDNTRGGRQTTTGSDPVTQPAATLPSADGDDPAVVLPDDPADAPPAPPSIDALAELADEGIGHPTEIRANRPAAMLVGDRAYDLPVTLWFTEVAAPGGVSPLVFNIRRDGSGLYDFALGSGAAARPVRFVAADGTPLEVLDVRFTLDDADAPADPDAGMRAIFKLIFPTP